MEGSLLEQGLDLVDDLPGNAGVVLKAEGSSDEADEEDE